MLFARQSLFSSGIGKTIVGISPKRVDQTTKGTKCSKAGPIGSKIRHPNNRLDWIGLESRAGLAADTYMQRRRTKPRARTVKMTRSPFWSQSREVEIHIKWTFKINWTKGATNESHTRPLMWAHVCKFTLLLPTRPTTLY